MFIPQIEIPSNLFNLGRTEMITGEKDDNVNFRDNCAQNHSFCLNHGTHIRW